MPLIKSRDDVYYLIVLGLTTAFILFLLSFSWLWVLPSPFIYLGATCMWFKLTGRPIKVAKDRSHKMTLVTVGEEHKSCLIHVLDDRIVVSTGSTKTTSASRAAVMAARSEGWHLPLMHSIELQVPYWKITQLLLEDKSSDSHSFHGLGIDFEDEDGAGRIMVFAAGFRSLKRIETLSEAIQTAQKELVRGLDLPEIEVIDLPAIRNYVGSGIIHRQ